MVHDRLVSLHGLRIKVKKRKTRRLWEERKTIGAVTMLPYCFSFLHYLFYRYSVVLLAATTFAVCVVSVLERSTEERTRPLRARVTDTRISIYIYVYRDRYRYYRQHACPCNVLRSVFLFLLFFDQSSYRSANPHEQSLASAAARLERGETCAASYIPL